MNAALTAIATRLAQPSTWAGGGIGFVLIHQMWPGGLGDSIDASIAALCATLAIILNEKNKTPPAV